jgi:hypothetical protein
MPEEKKKSVPAHEDMGKAEDMDRARGEIAWLYDHQSKPTASAYYQRKVSQFVGVIGMGAAATALFTGLFQTARGNSKAASLLNTRVVAQVKTASTCFLFLNLCFARDQP